MPGKPGRRLSSVLHAYLPFLVLVFTLGAIQKIAHGRNRSIARVEPLLIARERNCVAIHEACWQRNEREFVSHRMFVDGVLHGTSAGKLWDVTTVSLEFLDPFHGLGPELSHD